MKQMTITCPECGTQLAGDPSILGQGVECSECGKIFIAKADPVPLLVSQQPEVPDNAPPVVSEEKTPPPVLKLSAPVLAVRKAPPPALKLTLPGRGKKKTFAGSISKFFHRLKESDGLTFDKGMLN